jgi:hypothetical protein
MLASPPSLAMHTAAVLADLACGMVAHTDLPSRVARSHADVLWLWSTRVLVDLLSFSSGAGRAAMISLRLVGGPAALVEYTRLLRCLASCSAWTACERSAWSMHDGHEPCDMHDGHEPCDRSGCSMHEGCLFLFSLGTTADSTQRSALGAITPLCVHT